MQLRRSMSYRLCGQTVTNAYKETPATVDVSQRYSEETGNDEFDEFREGIDHAMWQLLTGYGRQRLPVFALGTVASVLSRALELVPAFIIGLAIDALFFDERAFALPGVPQASIPAGVEAQFWLAAGIIGGAFIFRGVLNWVNSWAWNYVTQHLQHDVRVDTYAALQSLKLGFFDTKQTGEVMSILNNDVNRLEEFLTSDLNTLIRIGVRVIGIGVIMLYLNWQLAIVALVVVPLLGVASVWFVRLIQPKYSRVRASVGGLNARLENNVSGIEAVKSYTNEAFEHDRVAESSREYRSANWDAITTRIKFWPTLQVLTGVGYLLTFIVGGYWVLFDAPWPFTTTLTAGVLVTFMLYTRRFMWPMRQFGEVLDSYQYAEAASQRVLGLIENPQRIPEPADGHELTDVAGEVSFENVSFSYANGEEVLHDVSFDVDPGEYIGLVGQTGAGKTTLMKLLLRLYDSDSGTIRVDGHDIRELTLESLRGSIGYISQEPFLFHGTVAENIRYGNQSATDQAVREAARQAGADTFIEELPSGYDTQVGERGVKLSGGQRQRVAIARALLADPEILILDEATSHVDNETEVLIQNNLEHLIAERTTFAIAHRLSTVRNADRIFVLDDGEIVERGSHDELLARDGLYANLWSVQVGEIENLPDAFVRRTRHSENVPGETD